MSNGWRYVCWFGLVFSLSLAVTSAWLASAAYYEKWPFRTPNRNDLA